MSEYAVRTKATVYVEAGSPEEAQALANADLCGINSEIEVHDAEVEKVSE